MQTLIQQYLKSHAQGDLKEIYKALQKQETLWAAFFPKTRHYFMGEENGSPAVYLFSEEAHFQSFAASMAEQGYALKAVKNAAANRMALFTDFFRTGAETVILDEGQQRLAVDLFALVQKPDFSKIQPEHRPVYNTQLLAKAVQFYQKLEVDQADKADELAMFHEIYKATYIMPLKSTTDANGHPQLGMTLMQDDKGRRFFAFYTDMNEIRQSGQGAKCSAKLVNFADLVTFARKADGIVINPTGLNIKLDLELLGVITLAEQGDLPDASVQPSDSPMEAEIEALPAFAERFAQKAAELVKQQADVNIAYLCFLRKPEGVPNSYLFVLDAAGDAKAVYDALVQELAPLAGERNIEFLPYDAGTKALVKKYKPIYKKRRFGLFGKY